MTIHDILFGIRNFTGVILSIICWLMIALWAMYNDLKAKNKNMKMRLKIMQEPIEDSYKILYKELNDLEPSHAFANPTSNSMLSADLVKSEIMRLFSKVNKGLIILDENKVDIEIFMKALDEDNLTRRKLENITLEANRVFNEKVAVCINKLNKEFDKIRISD